MRPQPEPVPGRQRRVAPTWIQSSRQDSPCGTLSCSHCSAAFPSSTGRATLPPGTFCSRYRASKSRASSKRCLQGRGRLTHSFPPAAPQVPLRPEHSMGHRRAPRLPPGSPQVLGEAWLRGQRGDGATPRSHCRGRRDADSRQERGTCVWDVGEDTGREQRGMGGGSEVENATGWGAPMDVGTQGWEAPPHAPQPCRTGLRFPPERFPVALRRRHVR